MYRKSYTPLFWAFAPALFLVGLVWVASGLIQQRANAASDPNASDIPPKPSHPNALPTPPPAPSLETFTTQVQPGDSLSLIFERHGFTARDLHLLVESGPLGKQLKDIYPGYEIEFGRDAEHNLIHLKYRPGRWKTVEFQRVGDEFEGSTEVKTPDAVESYRHATIDHSLFLACRRIGLDDAFAMELAEIFRWDIDMFLDIRKGDEFHVLYEEHQIDGQFADFGDILAAEFINRGKSYKAVRYIDHVGGPRYYTPSGDNLRKAFLRAPLKYSRISSNFSLRRVHPLWNKTMPHLGIDYAAPAGTPVRAAGDGHVVTRSKSPSKGNYLVLQHGERYQTKYLHLSRFARGVEPGSQVEQGQVIGFVGATGWATGPHLHYEFLVDGKHTNPSRIQLPPAEPITADESERFDASTKPLLVALENYKNNRSLAYLSPLLPPSDNP